jgi:hypothetical protein
MGKEYSDFLMLQKECTLHQTRTMTATSTTIPPALKGTPAPLGDTQLKIFRSIVLQMFGFRYGFDLVMATLAKRKLR